MPSWEGAALHKDAMYVRETKHVLRHLLLFFLPAYTSVPPTVCQCLPKCTRANARTNTGARGSANS
eukprot:7297953-Lingulodinium_polyedra.AAC.1